MNRLEKKCCIASGGFHLLLLLLIVVVGMGFFSSRSKPDDLQAITMIPLDAKLTDGPSQTGGTPAAAPPPTAPAPPTPPAPPAPPEVVEPTPPEPPKQTLLEKIFSPAPPKAVEKDEPAVEPTPKTSTKPQVEVNKKMVKVSSTKTTKTLDDSEAKAAAVAAANAARKARAAAINRALGNLENSLSSGTEVSVPGPGAGTFLNYAEAVKRIYTDAWIAPTDVTDDEATAKVSVTISRDGNVILARMKTPSGSAAVDRSVQETLRRVKFIAPFPDGAKDSERTFIINFNLKAKKLLG